MEDKRVEGVVLRATPYKENDRILTLLTPDRGVISLYVRGLSKNKPANVAGIMDTIIFSENRSSEFHLN